MPKSDEDTEKSADGESDQNMSLVIMEEAPDK